jgi:hypothetical protein
MTFWEGHMTLKRLIDRDFWVLVLALFVSGLAFVVSAQTPPPEEKKPSEAQMVKAQLVKLQMEHLELQKQFATCQQQIVAGTARTTEQEILKAIDAKPGQKFDWNTMTVTPVPTTPPQPVEKKP